MADSNELGWKVVQEYTANPLADDSDDDKKILRAQARAERKIKAEKAKKKRPVPYNKPTSTSTAKSSQKPGVCYNCFKPGHWQYECPEKKRNAKLSRINLLSSNVFERVALDSRILNSDNCHSVNVNKVVFNSTTVTSSNCSLERDGQFQPSRQSTQVKIITPVGQLKQAIHKWQEVGASEYILRVIDRGYGIPFKKVPETVFLKNNKSSRENSKFVLDEISKLLEKGCISEVSEAPAVVNPLTVAYSRSGKPRLVLDCRHINECIHQFKFKFEDGSVARQIFEKGDFLFRFNLKVPIIIFLF